MAVSPLTSQLPSRSSLRVTGCIATIVSGKITDFSYRRIAAKLGIPLDNRRNYNTPSFPFETVRLQVAFPLVIVIIVTYTLYGWMVQHQSSLAVPLLLQGILGLCCTPAMRALYALLIDMFPNQPATASEACNLVRAGWGQSGQL